MKSKKNILIKNALFILITSMLIRIIGLVNRIILTRTLGQQGISIYTIIMPTIMLFLSLGVFSINTAMTKVVAKNPGIKTIKKGLTIAIIASTISSIILLVIARYLTLYWLKQPAGYFPIIISIPLIYLTAISSVLRGYYNGIQKMSITSIANLIEQIARIAFTIAIFQIYNQRSLVFLVTLSVLAMSIGEVFSILFTISRLKKYKTNDNSSTSRDLLNIAIPTTASQMISGVTFFLEPIIYTFSLTLLGIDNNLILTSYSEITAYALPLITLFSFISITIATVIMPNIASASPKQIKVYIEKILFLTSIPALIISILMYNYANEYTFLLYKTTIGASYVKKYALIFLVFYFISPLTAIMQATDKSKKLFIFSTIIHIIKLILIFALPFITTHALILSYLVTYYLYFIIIIICLKKSYKFEWQYKKFFTLILIGACMFFLGKILIASNINYLLSSIIICLTYLGLVTLFFFRMRHNE